MEFRRTQTLEEALDSLAELGSDAQILAGGTDVMVQYQRGEIDPKILVHIERIPELAQAEHQNGSLVLGPLVTHHGLTNNPQLSTKVPALAEAAATVGGWQTQEVGTVVGNVCNASPAADTIPPLLVAETTIQLASQRVTRTLPLNEFLLGRRRTARNPDELVTGLKVGALPPNCGEVYLKVGPRSGMEVAVVGLAVRLGFDDEGVVTYARVAACSVAPVPFRAQAAERILLGSRLEPDAVSEAGHSLSATADPIDDPRATAAYRQRVLTPLLRRAVELSKQRSVSGGA